MSRPAPSQLEAELLEQACVRFPHLFQNRADREDALQVVRLVAFQCADRCPELRLEREFRRLSGDLGFVRSYRGWVRESVSIREMAEALTKRRSLHERSPAA